MWLEWLPWAEYYYNTTFHSTLSTTPFQVVYDRPPPVMLSYEPTSAHTMTMDTLLQDHNTFLADICDRLLQAQAYAKRNYVIHH